MTFVRMQAELAVVTLFWEHIVDGFVPAPACVGCSMALFTAVD